MEKNTMDITDIISILFKKYDEPYNNVEPIPKNSQNMLDFKDIIMELKNIEKKCIKLNQKKFNLLFKQTINIKNISETNFIEDMDLLEKIIVYRKLVIRHLILIINYNIMCYNALVVNILFIKSHKKSDMDDIEIKNDIEKLENFKTQRKFIITSILGKSGKYYEETLCKYIEINKKLQLAKQHKINNII